MGDKFAFYAMLAMSLIGLFFTVRAYRQFWDIPGVSREFQDKARQRVLIMAVVELLGVMLLVAFAATVYGGLCARESRAGIPEHFRGEKLVDRAEVSPVETHNLVAEARRGA